MDRGITLFISVSRCIITMELITASLNLTSFGPKPSTYLGSTYVLGVGVLVPYGLKKYHKQKAFFISG